MLFAVGGEIMDTVSGFELDDMKIYRIRKIEIISSEFWSKDEYLMYLMDEEWKETKVWILRRFLMKFWRGKEKIIFMGKTTPTFKHFQ